MNYQFLPDATYVDSIALIVHTIAGSQAYKAKVLAGPASNGGWGEFKTAVCDGGICDSREFKTAAEIYLSAAAEFVAGEFVTRLALYNEPTEAAEAAEATKAAKAANNSTNEGPVLVLPEERLTVYAGGSPERALRHYHARRAEGGAGDAAAVAAAAAAAASATAEQAATAKAAAAGAQLQLEEAHTAFEEAKEAAAVAAVATAAATKLLVQASEGVLLKYNVRAVPFTANSNGEIDNAAEGKLSAESTQAAKARAVEDTKANVIRCSNVYHTYWTTSAAAAASAVTTAATSTTSQLDIARHSRRTSWGGYAYLRDWVHAEMSRVARRRCEEQGLDVAGRACRDLRASLCRSPPFRNTFPGYEHFVAVGNDRAQNDAYDKAKAANLFAAVANAKASGCVETGTFRGDTTARLAASSTGCPRGVVTVELNADYAADARARFAGDPRVTVLEGDSATAMAQQEDLFHRMRGGGGGAGKERCEGGAGADVADDSGTCSGGDDGGGGGDGGGGSLFWFLDGHYSATLALNDDGINPGHKTARGEHDSPIIGELDFVLRRLPASRKKTKKKKKMMMMMTTSTSTAGTADEDDVLDDPSYFQDTILIDDA